MPVVGRRDRRLRARARSSSASPSSRAPRLVQIVRAGVDVDAEAPVHRGRPAERRWPTRTATGSAARACAVRVPAGSLATAARTCSPRTADGEVVVHRAPSTRSPQRREPVRAARLPRPAPARRPRPAAVRRRQRLPHPARQPRREGRGGDNSTLIAPARTFDTSRNDVAGGVYFAFSKYSRPGRPQQPVLKHGADPSRTRRRAAPIAAHEYSAVRLQRREPLRLPRRPVRRLRLHGQPRLPGRQPAVRLRAGERGGVPDPS